MRGADRFCKGGHFGLAGGGGRAEQARIRKVHRVFRRIIAFAERGLASGVGDGMFGFQIGMDLRDRTRRVGQRFGRLGRRAEAIRYGLAISEVQRAGIHSVILGYRLHDLSMGPDGV